MTKIFMPDGREWYDARHEGTAWYLKGRRLSPQDIVRITSYTSSALVSRIRRYGLTPDEAFNLPPAHNERLSIGAMWAAVNRYREWMNGPASPRPPVLPSAPRPNGETWAPADSMLPPVQVGRGQTIDVRVMAVDPVRLDEMLDKLTAIQNTLEAIFEHLTRPDD